MDFKEDKEGTFVKIACPECESTVVGYSNKFDLKLITKSLSFGIGSIIFGMYLILDNFILTFILTDLESFGEFSSNLFLSYSGAILWGIGTYLIIYVFMTF